MHDDEDRLSDVKQALINKEILEKGHAPQDFDYYLQQVKGRSTNSIKFNDPMPVFGQNVHLL
jgi:hypothetical protein